jgi:hypothetical protein
MKIAVSTEANENPWHPLWRLSVLKELGNRTEYRGVIPFLLSVTVFSAFSPAIAGWALGAEAGVLGIASVSAFFALFLGLFLIRFREKI